MNFFIVQALELAKDSICRLLLAGIVWLLHEIVQELIIFLEALESNRTERFFAKMGQMNLHVSMCQAYKGCNLDQWLVQE